MTNEILTPQYIGGNFRRYRICRPPRRPHQPRRRSPEECIQIWERAARRRAFIRPKRNNQADSSRLKGQEGEVLLADWLRSQGYQVETTGNNENYDLVVEGILRVEVKLSLWNEQWDSNLRRPRHRFQFRIHPPQSQNADLFVLIARNGDDNYFIIPGQVLGRQRSVTIRTFDPATYTGKWAPYLGAWELLEAALAAVRGAETPSVASTLSVDRRCVCKQATQAEERSQ